jgi:dTDP-4-amino-4,6-dideoxygalactose transaminase
LTGTTEIPFVALDRQHEAIRADLHAALARVVARGAFILGEEVEAFEAEFAEYVGVRECVGVSSGTAALTIALQAAGIGPGDEVLVPGMTFIASALAVIHAGAAPVLCDVHDSDGLIDIESAAASVTERTAAIMPVHLYGQLCDMESVEGLAQRFGLAVIEDAAQAHGAARAGRRAGAFGLASGFSFYPSKNLGALGDAGAVCTDSPELAELARRLRDLGREGHGIHREPGWNARLDGLQAAVLRLKLKSLDQMNRVRRQHASAYRALLPADLRPLDRTDESCVYHLFPIRTPNRDALRRDLGASGIQTGIHYSPALHSQPALSAYPPAEPLDGADAWAKQELSLPIFPELRPDEIERVAETVVERGVAQL